MEKLVSMPKKMILTSEERVKHPFAGCNVQHRVFIFNV